MDGIAIKAMVSELAPVMREFVEAATKPLLERIAVLETEKGALVTRCEALEEAATKAPEIDLTGVQKLIEAEIAKLPEPVDTADLLEPLNARIAELEAREPVAGPPGEKGDKGDPGEKGLDGIGKDGRDGNDGQDGAGIADLLRDHEGNLVATFTDGRLKNLGPIQGQDGKDGRDGFGFDDMDACVLDDDRTIELSFKRGDEEKAFTFKWPTMIYRDVFKDGTEYQHGDVVTWGGSLWHCNQATKDKPGTDSWTLAAKKGRDGKDAKVG